MDIKGESQTGVTRVGREEPRAGPWTDHNGTDVAAVEKRGPARPRLESATAERRQLRAFGTFLSVIGVVPLRKDAVRNAVQTRRGSSRGEKRSASPNVPGARGREVEVRILPARAQWLALRARSRPRRMYHVGISY